MSLGGSARHRILLVDDEDLICRSILRTMKGQTRFEIRAVTRSIEAANVFIDEGPFDLLLTDIYLPGIGGRELARKLVRAKPDLKVVFMSGDVAHEFSEPHRFIVKPFDQNKLVQVLDEVLRSTQRELE